MGYVELNDGVSTRRIPLAELPGVVRIEVGSGDPCVVVPEGLCVERPGGGAADAATSRPADGFDFAGER